MKKITMWKFSKLSKGPHNKNKIGSSKTEQKHKFLEKKLSNKI